MVGSTMRAGPDILVARSTDNGATWTAPAVLNANADGRNLNPQVTTDRMGHWVAMWGSDDSLGGTIGEDYDILVERGLPPENNNEQKCINELNGRGAQVAAVRGKENRLCVKNAGKAKLPGTATACLVAGRQIRVARAMKRTIDSEIDECTGVAPRFAKTDAATVNQAAVGEEVNLTRDIFGADLDAAIIPCNADRRACMCQYVVARDADKIARTMLKVFNTCAEDALKSGAVEAAAIAACPGTDPNEKIPKAVARLSRDVGKRCNGVLSNTAFPGTCRGARYFSGCVAERVACRTCLMVTAMDALETDCDQADDGVTNSSCPP
ncbi:MAG: hypothetical protein ACE5I7_08040 [Candidatus Binatia bacterium]